MPTLKSCVLLLILAQLATTASSVTALGSRNEADFAIRTAEEAMASAYQAVKEAETAGADISGARALLKDASQLLAQAHTLFRVGDFDSAARFANLTSEIGEEVQGKVYPLREIKQGLSTWQMFWTMIGSFLGVSAVVLTSFLSWSVFKRLYYRRIRAMEPGVTPDES